MIHKTRFIEQFSHIRVIARSKATWQSPMVLREVGEIATYIRRGSDTLI